MSSKFDTEIVVNAAKLYHVHGLKQQEVADRLKVSRAMVSLMLTEARRMGIVEIHVRDPQLDNVEYGNAITDYFSLDRCYVVPTSSKDADVLRELVAGRTVRLFSTLVSDGDSIGVSWGRTCRIFMSVFFSERKYRSTSVIPLVGTSNKNVSQYQLNEMVRQFASSFEAQPHFLHSPALPPSVEDFELYAQSSNLRMTFELWNRIDLAIVAIGSAPLTEEFDGSEISDSHKLMNTEIVHYTDLPVGNLCARYFNIDGTFLNDEVNQRTISISPESMRKIPRVIAMAAGQDKACSVIGALKTGVVKTLVIDEPTARLVLNMIRSDTNPADIVLELYENADRDVNKNAAGSKKTHQRTARAVPE